MNKVYMISYDLYSPTKNRKKVEDSIESLGNWCKYVSTTYLVSTSKDISQVQSIATKSLDSNDSMIICEVKKPICGWLNQKQWEWIHKNL